MTFDKHEILDILDLIFYVPALPLAAYVAYKHGFGRSSGWLYLIVLALLRIIGAITDIASVHNPSSKGLLETAAICEAIGLSPLILALLGILQRVMSGMQERATIPPQFTRVLSIPVLVGLGLGIYGGTDQFSSKPSDVTNGQHYTEAAVIIFLVSFLVIAAITIVTGLKTSHVLSGEKKLMFAALASLPLIFVRIIYSIIIDFDHNSSTFKFNPNTVAGVIVQAFMALLMEFNVVGLYLLVGLLTDRASKYSHNADIDVEQTY